MDTDVQYYCTTALSNIAVDGANRKKLAQTEPKLVTSLVALMDSPSLKVQCQAALALRNLASDGQFTFLCSMQPLILWYFYCREISAGDRESGRSQFPFTPSAVNLSPAHPVLCCLCPQCLDSSPERVTDH